MLHIAVTGTVAVYGHIAFVGERSVYNVDIIYSIGYLAAWCQQHCCLGIRESWLQIVLILHD